MPFDAADFPPDANERAIRRARNRVLPTIIGYKIIREIRSGGQASVFEATQLSSNARVAIRVFKGMLWDHSSLPRDDGGSTVPATPLRIEDPQSKQREIIGRLEREISVLTRLDHPNIVRLLQSGTTQQGAPFLVMPFIEGTPLDTYVKENGPLSPKSALSIVQQVCSALIHAHDQGVIHRDLKPQNVMYEPASGQVTVLDFGLSTYTYALSITRTDQIIGTPWWASPEHFIPKVTAKSDIYCLGLIYYFLLTRRLPYEVLPTCDLVGIAGVIKTYNALPPSSYMPLCSSKSSDLAHADNIVLTCLRKAPQDRYPTAHELGIELERLAAGVPTKHRWRRLVGDIRELYRNHRGLLVTAAVVFICAILTAGVSSVMWSRTDEQKRIADASLAAMQTMLLSTDPRRIRPGGYTVYEMLHDTLPLLKLDTLPRKGVPLKRPVGRLYTSLGMDREAAVYLREAYDHLDLELGHDDPETIAALVDVGWNHVACGNADEADACFEDAKGRLRGVQHPMLTDIRRGRAHVHILRHEWQDAERILRDLLAGELQSNATSHIALSLRRDLAGVILKRGDVRAAEQMARQILDESKHLFGDNHPQVANDMMKLATCLGSQQTQLAERIQLLRGARIILGRFVSARNTMIDLDIMLSTSCCDAGDFRAAEVASQRAVEACENVIPNSDTHTKALLALGNARKGLKDFDTGRKAYSAGLAIAASVFPPDDEQVLALRASLGALELEAGNPKAAEPELQATYSLLSFCLGPSHPRALTAGKNYAASLLARSRNREAAAVLQELLDLERHVYSMDSLRLARTEQMLGQSLSYGGMSQEAASEYMWDAYVHSCDALGPYHHDTISRHNDYLRSLVILDRLVNAVDQITAALDEQRQLAIPLDLTKRTRLVLCETQRRLGDIENATNSAYALLADLKANGLGETPFAIDTMRELGRILRCDSRFALAEDVLRTANGLSCLITGDDSLGTAKVLELLAGVLEDLNRHEEAEMIARESLNLMWQYRASHQLSTVDNYCTIARAALSRSDSKQALQAIEEGIVVGCSAHLAEWEWLMLWNLYGSAIVTTGARDEGADWLQWTAIESTKAQRIPLVIRSQIVDRWVQYLTMEGRATESEQWKHMLQPER